jgi:hypothetical protein
MRFRWLRGLPAKVVAHQNYANRRTLLADRGRGRMPFGRRLTTGLTGPAKRQAANQQIVCAGQEAGLTIPRRMPSGPTTQIVAAREEMNI